MDVVTLALAKKYTKDTTEGMGAIQGSPCTVKSTAYDTDGNTVVTFAWKDTNNVEHTQNATIKRGIRGDSIVSCSVNEETGAITFVTGDGESLTPIVIPLSETVTQNKKDIALLQETVKTLGGSVTLKVVTDLPTTNIKTSVIYLKTTSTEGKYDQYIWTIEDGTGSWTSLGPTEANLSEYFQKENIVAEFEETTSDYKVPSEKLVKDSLNKLTIQHYVTQTEYDAMEEAGTLVADDDYNIIEE